jgi:hypothetical protein
MKGNEEKGFESAFLQRGCWATTGLHGGKALPIHTVGIPYSEQVHSKPLKCRRDSFVTVGWLVHNLNFLEVLTLIFRKPQGTRRLLVKLSCWN